MRLSFICRYMYRISCSNKNYVIYGLLWIPRYKRRVCPSCTCYEKKMNIPFSRLTWKWFWSLHLQLMGRIYSWSGLCLANNAHALIARQYVVAAEKEWGRKCVVIHSFGIHISWCWKQKYHKNLRMKMAQ